MMDKQSTYDELMSRIMFMEKAVAAHAGVLKSFFTVARSMRDERNIDRLLPEMMTGISSAVHADRSTLFLIPWENMDLWTKFAQGLEGDTIHLDLQMGLIGACVLNRKVVNVANAYEDPRFNPDIDRVSGYRTESVLCVPFMNQEEEVIGAVELLNRETGVFTDNDEYETVKAVSMFSEIHPEHEPDRAKALLHDLCTAVSCERGTVFMLDRDNGELVSVIAEGSGDIDIRLSLNLGFAGLVAVTGHDLNIPDAYADPRFDKSFDQQTGYRTKTLLCVPIRNQTGQIIGVIEAINKKHGVFDDNDMEVLKALSCMVAIVIENAILARDHQMQFRSMLSVLAASIDAKDPLTAGHSQKVEEYAVGIAAELGFRDDDLDIISVSALLHDYGKLGTDENILKKPGKLTEEEYLHIQEHVVNTRKILEKMYLIRKYRNVPLIAACHHERLDGTGYPQKLKGNEIPYMAKIIAVADVFEALTAKRHYRDAMPTEKAFEIMDKDVGTKFDEHIVNALKAYLKR